MNDYIVWWKVRVTKQILNTTIEASSLEDAKSKILKKYGYKNWDIQFTKVEIC